MSLKSVMRKARNGWLLIKHFKNPFLILFARLGWINVPYSSFSVRKSGIEYNLVGRLLGGDHRILREVLVEQTYRSVLELLPPKPLRVVDIGAHIGAFILWLNQQHRVNGAFCFEPDAESFTLCQFNLSQSGYDNIRLHRQAIGGSTRESKIWIDPSAHARSSIYKDRHATVSRHGKIQIVALNEWLEKIGGDFDLLKMDCEGSEWEILESCPEAFERFSIIVAEIHRDPIGKRNIQDFAAALSEHGFTTVSCGPLYIGRRYRQEPKFETEDVSQYEMAQ
jgi:FkbM family methyltransferase